MLNRFEMIKERLSFYGCVVCENCLSDIEFIVKGENRESNREKELLEILKEEKGGISMNEICERMGINKGNVSSILMGIRKKGVKVLIIDKLYVLGEYVNIGQLKRAGWWELVGELIFNKNFWERIK